MSLMVNKFDRTMRRFDHGNRRPFVNNLSTRPDKSTCISDQKCYECQGFQHFKADCPTIKKKEAQCYKCKGYGHTQSDCVTSQNGKSKSYIGFNDSDSKSESEQGDVTSYCAITGYCAFPAMGVSEEDSSENEYEDEVSDFQEEFKSMYKNWKKVTQENVLLIKEKIVLKDLNDKLKNELNEEVSKRKL